MKTRRVSLLAMAFTLVFALANVTVAKADLSFANGPATWWKTTKQLDTGYLFLPVTDDGTVAKAKKFKVKQKPGYMYIPESSFDVVTSTYVGVIQIDKDQNGVWITTEYNFIVKGGTPNDFAAHTDGPIPPVEGATMALTIRAKLTEDKKNPGTIKSGNVRTLGSSLLIDIPALIIFAGTTDFRARWIPATKVPDAVMALVPQP